MLLSRSFFQPDQLEFVGQFRFAGGKAFPLRGRLREAPDEVAQCYEFAESSFNS